jgi:hypothetical protein
VGTVALGLPVERVLLALDVVAAMTVIIPLDGVALMVPGKLYSLDLEQTEDGYIGTVRPWRVTDVEPPIKVAERTVANTVTLEALP